MTNIAEAAEKLANSSPNRSPDDIAKQANLLKNRIHSLLKKNRPSRNNVKFIRFAIACIKKAKKQEPVMKKKPFSRTISLESFYKKEISFDSLELAEWLYELAKLLYQKKENAFQKAFQTCSENHQKEIVYHISLCGGTLLSLEEEKNRLCAVQGILGYAHILSDYYTETPYPSLEEIHDIFQDLHFVIETEKKKI